MRLGEKSAEFDMLNIVDPNFWTISAGKSVWAPALDRLFSHSQKEYVLWEGHGPSDTKS